MLLLLSHFCRVRLCATPQMAAHQAPLSLGFSRQEHWSGLSFPAPMHEESESESEVAQSGPETPIIGMLAHLMLSLRSLRLSFLFILLSLFCVSDFYQSVEAAQTLPSLSALLPQLFCYLFLLVYFSFQLLYSSCLFLFFSSPRSLLNISYILSIHASILF